MNIFTSHPNAVLFRRTNTLKIIFYSFLLFLFAAKISYTQMPDWTLIIDNDRNRYYLDKNGKIWTSGEPEFDYKPVSANGLEYYLNQGIELIKNHHKTEGLILLKSILCMPAENEIIYNAQKKASREINKLLKNEGSRFGKLNEDASILLFKTDNHVTMINDDMKYSFKCPSVYSLNILSKRIRRNNNYKYFGILIGLRFYQVKSDTTKKTETQDIKPKKGYSGYDLLIAIDSEIFAYKLKNINLLESHWRKRIGHDTLKRELITDSKEKIIYEYRDDYFAGYSGIEGFYKKNNTGYFLKAVAGQDFFKKNKTVILELIRNFKIN